MKFNSLEIADKLDIFHDSLKRMVKKYELSCIVEKSEVKTNGGRPTEVMHFNLEEFKTLLAFLQNNEKTSILKKSINNNSELINTYVNLEKSEKRGYLYMLEVDNKTKIGITTRLDKRIRVLTSHMGIEENCYKLEVKESEKFREYEKLLHSAFSKKRICGEWFNVSIEEIVNSEFYKKEVI